MVVVTQRALHMFRNCSAATLRVDDSQTSQSKPLCRVVIVKKQRITVLHDANNYSKVIIIQQLEYKVEAQ